MNSVSTTGMVAFGGTQLDGVVIYLAQILHLPTPDAATAAAIGVGLVMGTHALYQFVSARWPAKVAAPALIAASAPAPVVTPPVAAAVVP